MLEVGSLEHLPSIAALPAKQLLSMLAIPVKQLSFMPSIPCPPCLQVHMICQLPHNFGCPSLRGLAGREGMVWLPEPAWPGREGVLEAL